MWVEAFITPITNTSTKRARLVVTIAKIFLLLLMAHLGWMIHPFNKVWLKN
jgi:hypothetical protein